MNSQIEETAQRLCEAIRPLTRCAVAFSGGVDSAVVAKAAYQALGDRAVAITGSSPSLSPEELHSAKQLAAVIGIRHRIVNTNEIELDAYRRNDGQRCYHCKTELYGVIGQLKSEEKFEWVLSGTNIDDLGEYRPGIAAAAEANVRHPLVECQIDKQTVRELARWWTLDVWDKPASPCLSSRLAYGVHVTAERLQRIDASERFLRGLGFSPLRVRYHEGDHARIELPIAQVERLAREPTRSIVTSELARLGFRFISLDLIGFRSGGLNALLQIEPSAVGSVRDSSEVISDEKNRSGVSS
jgi:uncharacterized protein